MRSIVGVVYVIIGVVVASNQGYLGDIGGFGDALNLALAILLWPLLLLGVDFRFGRGNRSFVLFGFGSRAAWVGIRAICSPSYGRATERRSG